MQTYSQALGAGGTLPIHATTKFFRILDCPDPVDVRFWRAGSLKSVSQGVGVGFWVKPTLAFDRVEISSATAQTVVVAVGEGDGGYDRVSITGSVNVLGTVAVSGTTEIVDGEYNRVVANQCFIQGGTLAAPGAFNNMLALRKIGSTKTIQVKRVLIGSVTAQTIYIGMLDGTQLSSFSNTGATPKSFLSGGGGPVEAQIRTPAAMPVGVAWGGSAIQWTVAANSAVWLEFPRPWVINLNNYGLALACNTANTTLTWGFEFVEQ